MQNYGAQHSKGKALKITNLTGYDVILAKIPIFFDYYVILIEILVLFPLT